MVRIPKIPHWMPLDKVFMFPCQHDTTDTHEWRVFTLTFENSGWNYWMEIGVQDPYPFITGFLGNLQLNQHSIVYRLVSSQAFHKRPKSWSKIRTYCQIRAYQNTVDIDLTKRITME